MAARLQRLAQMKHISLQCPDPPVGRIPAPDVFGQAVHRDDPVRLQQQQGKNGPLPRPTQRHLAPGPGDLQRPKDAVLNGHRLGGYRVSSHLIPRPVDSPAARASGFDHSTTWAVTRSTWCSKPLIQAVPKAIPDASHCYVLASTHQATAPAADHASLTAGQRQPRQMLR
jgi:hypothetical protein